MRGIRVGGAVLAVGLCVVVALGSCARSGEAAPATSPPPASSHLASPSSLPSGGLTHDQIVAKVRASYAGSGGTIGQLQSAVAGPFATVSGGMPANVKPDRLVWALKFDATSGPIWKPDGSGFLPSETGTLTLYLDYYTGESLAGSGDYQP